MVKKSHLYPSCSPLVFTVVNRNSHIVRIFSSFQGKVEQSLPCGEWEKSRLDLFVCARERQERGPSLLTVCPTGWGMGQGSQKNLALKECNSSSHQSSISVDLYCTWLNPDAVRNANRRLGYIYWATYCSSLAAKDRYT